jgi:hypothetical protein
VPQIQHRLCVTDLERTCSQQVRCWRREELRKGSARIGSSAVADLLGARRYSLLGDPSASPSRNPAHSGAPSTSTQVEAVHSSTTTTTTTTATSALLSASSFFFEPCAAIVGSPPVTSNLDLRPFLLGAAQLPAGGVIDGPHQTSTTPAEPKTYASVPTTSPVAYENITLSTATTSGGTAALGLSEVIGDVGSVSFANQLLSMLDADLNGPGCNPNGADTISLPGTNPPVSATSRSGKQRSGSELGARLFAAKGSRLLCLTWGSNVAVNASGLSAEPSLPPLPDGPAMAQVLNTALALIPS